MPYFSASSSYGPTLALLETWRAQGFLPGPLWLAAAGDQPAGVVQALRARSVETGTSGHADVGENLNAADPQLGWTPLMMLLKMAGDRGRSTSRNPSDLDLANDLQTAAALLLDAGGDPFVQDAEGVSATAYAAASNAGSWLTHLARSPGILAPLREVRVPRKYLSTWAGAEDPDLMTFLLRRQGAGVEALLQAGWPPNAVSPDGVPVLHQARNLLDLQRLLAAGADPLSIDAQGGSAAMAFTRSVDDTDARNRMLGLLNTAQQQRLQDDPSQQQRWRRMEFGGLFQAISSATKDTFVKLYRSVVIDSLGELTADTPSPAGVRLLEEAWRQEKLPIVTYLLDQGANPLLPGSHGLPVWLGHLAMGPVPRERNAGKDAAAREQRLTERRVGILQRVIDEHHPDLNARLPDGRSLLLGLITAFPRLAPSFEETFERDRPGRRPKALWWAVHQLLKMGADPRTQDRVGAFPLMDGEDGSHACDVRWPAALAVGVIPTLGTHAPTPEHMGMGSAYDITRLLDSIRSPHGPATPTVPIASAWFATLVGSYNSKASNAPFRDAPLLLQTLAPLAEMPSHHPLAHHTGWQAEVQRVAGEFALVLEQNALRRAAQDVRPTPTPDAGRRRL